MPTKSPRRAALALTLVALVVVAGCSSSSSSSSPSAKSTQVASPSSTPTTPAVPTAPGSPTPSVTGGPPAPAAITPAALTALINSYSVLNNTANAANSLTLLKGVDTQVALAGDAGYTKADARNGLKSDPFFTAAQHVAVAATPVGAMPYAIVDADEGLTPPKAGKIHGKTSPLVAAYVKTPQGWRLANSVDLDEKGAALPALAPATNGVVNPGVTAGENRLVTAAARACSVGRSSSLVDAPAYCADLTPLPSSLKISVTSSVGSTTWPSYSVALANGHTLILGAVNVTVKVRGRGGIVIKTANVITGLLGSKAKSDILVPNGYAATETFSVGLDVPPSGPAKVLGVDTNPLSARLLKPSASSSPSGPTVSV